MKSNSEEKNYLDTITIFTIFFGVLFLIITCTIFLFHFDIIGYKEYLSSNSMAQTGQIGDFIGGILGPVFSLVGIFLVYKTLEYQREDIKSNQESNNFSHLTEIVFKQVDRYDTLVNYFHFKDENGIKAILKFNRELKLVCNPDKDSMILNHFPNNHENCSSNIILINNDMDNIYDFVYPLSNSINGLNNVFKNSNLSKIKKDELRELYYNNIGYTNLELFNNLYATFDSAMFYRSNEVQLPEYDLDKFAKIFLNISVIKEFN